MRAMAAAVTLVVLAAPAGFLNAAEGAESPACPQHPFPCGDAWPAGLSGPFTLAERRPLPVLAHDGVVLDGYAWLPSVPNGTLLGTVLTTLPYAGQCGFPQTVGAVPSCLWALDHPSFMESTLWRSHRFDAFIEAGFAVVVASVRGTGSSGGCFELLGPNERRDQATIINAVAQTSWSNGRVGMWGASYMGATAWLGGVTAPAAIKTIVPVASVTDLFLTTHTPNGAARADGGTFFAGYSTMLGEAPPLGGYASDNAAWAERRPSLDCSATHQAVANPALAQVGDDREAAFYAARNALADAGNVTAATWLVHGFDETRSGVYQDDDVWRALPASTPKRFTLGQWGHTTDVDDGFTALTGETFTGALVAWFDYWLKGIGAVPPLGVVDYQDTANAWRTATAWPPQRDASATLPVEGTFVAASTGARAPLCGFFPGTLAATSLDAAGASLGAAAVVAGASTARLTLSVDQPGGTVAVDVYRLPPDYACSSDGSSARPAGLVTVASGAVDLRHVADRYAGAAPPLGTPFDVTVQLTSVASRLAPGDRLAVTLTAAGEWNAEGAPFQPRVHVHAGSVVDVPLIAA